MKEYKVRKRFGQNFLQDTRIIADIVNTVCPQADSVMIEIGPGLAVITEPLAKRLNRPHVIEIDRDTVGRLKTLPFADKLVIHGGDMLQFGFSGVAGKKKTAGSLPHNISTPFLFKLTEVADDVVEMHFMLQKEVVECMVVALKSNDYGRLGTMPQYFFDMGLLTDVPPESFDPTPKVDSAVVHVIPVRYRIGKADDFKHLTKLAKLVFRQRRKTVRNDPREFVSDEDLQAVGINPQDRAEHITLEKYAKLNNYLVCRTA